MMLSLLFAILLSFSGCVFSTSSRVQDWLTLRTKLEIVPTPSSGYISPQGTLRHAASSKILCPEWYTCPNNRYYMLFAGSFVMDYCRFSFIQVEGHLGFFEQDCGHVVVQPNGGGVNPAENTFVVVNKARDSGGLFYIDQEAKKIVHRGGKWIRPEKGHAFPIGDYPSQLQSIDDEAGRFIFDLVNSEDTLFPPPNLSGRWERLFGVIDPISEHSYTVEYKVGMTMVKQGSVVHSWKVSGSTSFDWFKSSAELSYFASISESVTWNVEIDREYTIKVFPGKSAITWQWVFEAERFGEVYQYRSTILGDTDDPNRPPLADGHVKAS